MDAVLAVPILRDNRVMEEAEWLPAARLGERWALERFYQLYQASVYALCHRLLSRAEDAQDATQTAFIRAFRELPRFRGESSLKTWMYRITVNEALGLLRKRRVAVALDESTGVSDGAPTVLERLAVRAALAQTSPPHRAILVLRFWEGLSYEEIAEVLGISLSATKMRLHRARDEFRKYYQEEL